MQISFFKDETVKHIFNELEELKKCSAKTAIIIDVETFGTSSNSVVFNLAALFFSLDPNEQSNLEKEYPNNFLNFRFDPSLQLELGREVDQDTVDWWRLEKNLLAMEAINKLPISDLKESMELLKSWCSELRKNYGCKIYHRGIDFDGPIIESLYETAGIKIKWESANTPRDIRSYIDAKLDINLGYVPSIPKSERGTAHTALGDCINDAKQMQLAYLYQKNKRRIYEEI